MQTFEHNGYQGSIEFDTRSDCLHGNILHITDLVTYEAESMPALRKAFIEAVDDYLETCKEYGIEPKRPYKGVFNVRMKPDLHQKAAMKATQSGMSLNELVNHAVEHYLNPSYASAVSIDHRTVNFQMFESKTKTRKEVTANIKPVMPVNELTLEPNPMTIRFVSHEVATVQ